MAVRIQTSNNFLGFGDGTRAGEYYYSVGMKRSQFGIKPGWSMVQSINSDTLDFTTPIKWFDQKKEAGANYIFGVAGYPGKIYKCSTSADTWTLARATLQQSYGNGLITDQKDRLLYAQNRYLGMYDGTTWTDNWKDIVDDIGLEWRPMELYEDWVLIGNKNKVALLNITDDSFNTAAFTLPSDFVIRSIKAGKNGVLIGANKGNQGILVLWDVYSIRSITPWIYTEGNITSIVKFKEQWIVAMNGKFLITNGYQILSEISLPDIGIRGEVSTPDYPAGMIIKDNYLFVTHSNITRQPNRLKNAVWIYDFRTRLWEICLASNNEDSVRYGALFFDNIYNFIVSYVSSSDVSSKRYIAKIYENIPRKSFYITAPLGVGGTKKTAEGLIFSLAFDTVASTHTPTPDWKITAKIFDFKKQLWNFSRTSLASTAANKLLINGSSPNFSCADVGDEVTVVEGVNANETRQVIAVENKGTISEAWTLDLSLPYLTEQYAKLNVSGFKKIGEKTISSHKLKDYYFNINQSPQGKKFLIKLLFESNADSSNFFLTPEVNNLSFIYNDLGVI